MFPEVVTLFGGDTNPLQKYVIDELAKTPEVSTVRVGTLFPDEFAANLPAAWLDKVVAEYVDITDQHSVLAASEGSQALVNMFDIPYEVELSFYDAHVGASKIISHAANTVFASRVIQVRGFNELQYFETRVGSQVEGNEDFVLELCSAMRWQSNMLLCGVVPQHGISPCAVVC